MSQSSLPHHSPHQVFHLKLNKPLYAEEGPLNTVNLLRMSGTRLRLRLVEDFDTGVLLRLALLLDDPALHPPLHQLGGAVDPVRRLGDDQQHEAEGANSGEPQLQSERAVEQRHRGHRGEREDHTRSEERDGRDPDVDQSAADLAVADVAVAADEADQRREREQGEHCIPEIDHHDPFRLGYPCDCMLVHIIHYSTK